MFMMRFMPVALTGLLLASQPVLAEEAAVEPDQGVVAAGGIPVVAVEAGRDQEAGTPSGGMGMAGPGMMGEQGGGAGTPGMATQPGMMGPGKPGCRMGKGGMQGMMPGAMAKGCKPGFCMEGSGISRKQYRELMGRLDVLEARMAKIDAMLERLLER
jgi:hypothetical protein